MIILAIQDGHNSSAALMINGRIIFALQEERFCQIKNYTGYPYQSIKHCLNYLKKRKLKLDLGGIASTFKNPYVDKVKMFNNFKPNDFKEWWRTKIQFNYFKKKNNSKSKFLKNRKRDKITINYLKKIKNKYKNKPEYYNFNFLNDRIINKPQLERELYQKERLNKFCTQTGLEKNQVKFIDHHTCHAYYGYYSSALNGKDCLISTIDGGGDGYVQSLWSIKKGRLKLLAKNNTCPLGRYWKIICVILSLKPMEHEYKIMGLAPYSKEKYTDEVFNQLKNLCKIKNYNIVETKIDKKGLNIYDFFEKKLSNYRFDAIAGGIQKFTEFIVVKYLEKVLKKTKHRNFVGSGGLFMNVKLNKVISEIKSIKDIFISGSAGDESLSIGACYYLNNKKRSYPLSNLYLGYEEKKIDLKKISKKKFQIKKINSINEITARLVKGEIVGMYNASAEFGARALGNRSILARPDTIGIVKKINEAVKNRDFWMPFALSILEKHHKKFIINKKSLKSPHMTIAFDTVKKNLKYIANGTHLYDETVRPQILEEHSNKKYYYLINEFYKQTKIPALLNTSLNLHGKPLVNDLSDALFTLENSELDCLIVNYKYLINKR